MDKVTLAAEKRSVTGRRVKSLRRVGLIPANVFGKKIKSFSLQVTAKDFEKVFDEAGETGIVELSIKNGKKPETTSVLISNVQKNPVTDAPLHIDFRRVDLKEKIEAEVPIEFIGESPAEKTSIGTVVRYINEVAVEALPADLPEKFEVDISNLSEVDQAVLVGDLKYDKAKVAIKDDPEKIVAKVEPPQKIEEVTPPAEAAVPGEAGEEVVEEGEAAKPEGEAEAQPEEAEKKPPTA
ncbi:MAG: 50S ribosomal protein L25 [Candidatus Woesebacteria bacterium GW2011_GWA1_45_8]|uniref:Large ribosomal subunit protein bL25 n=1 Tax=Candidatus Woesebacteria bacterium GW2011_GWA1_45_8 TaxID=1618559 RepID=A0A0G1QUR4_9BACT|nr:MAG: 50S ribosomal protein L25 [Candidatus Woesebacteria bacterium GW2011_GWA1_45_8]